MNNNLTEQIFNEFISVMIEMRNKSIFYNIFKKDIYLDFYVRDFYTDEDIINNIKNLNSKMYIDEFLNNIEQIL